MPMPSALRYLQYTGCALTEVLSIYLFLLIFSKASLKIGSYKYLMATFTVFSMIYGIVEVLTQPVMHIEGTALIVYMDSFLRYEKVLGFHITAFYCSSFGVCVLLLSTHFCYRYMAVCRPHIVRNYTGARLLYFFIPAAVLGTTWLVTVEICEQPTPFNSEYLRESLKFYYDEDSYAVAQLSAVYYYYDKCGVLVIHWLQCFSILILYSIMGTSITSIVLFAFKTYKTVQTNTLMSAATRDLHRQLLFTLIIQSLVPFVILFAPVGLLFLLPFFNVHLGYFANAPGAWISFYPAIDALIALLMIRDFRNAVFCRKHNSSAQVTGNYDSMTISNFRRQSHM
ncbi:Serpentine receptor class r-10 [Caenorhabditis elegans]|uniref:Serpentine receptor class r-10 n=2 Tax=Caenorhabditis elegans TaxID=6239 RepID=Q9N4Y5_CAEEL|nr:Seven TM Receptor [Caenorhabditis elegans]CCD62305.1 Seven TM Receptor [Caenorhabditis elegans]|eukprot:NP_503693.2 Uncharacterized protein CELE_Y45G12C.10 [Caenorhabditis elegans]